MHTARFAEARAALNEALALVEKNDERFQEAELHRLKGELLLAESARSNRGGAMLPPGRRDSPPPAEQSVGTARHNEPRPALAKARPPGRSVQGAQHGARRLRRRRPRPTLWTPQPYSKASVTSACARSSRPVSNTCTTVSRRRSTGWFRLIGATSQPPPSAAIRSVPLGGRRSSCPLPHRRHGTRAGCRAAIRQRGQRDPRGRITRGRHESPRSSAGPNLTTSFKANIMAKILHDLVWRSPPLDLHLDLVRRRSSPFHCAASRRAESAFLPPA